VEADVRGSGKDFVCDYIICSQPISDILKHHIDTWSCRAQIGELFESKH